MNKDSSMILDEEVVKWSDTVIMWSRKYEDTQKKINPMDLLDKEDCYLLSWMLLLAGRKS